MVVFISSIAPPAKQGGGEYDDGRSSSHGVLFYRSQRMGRSGQSLFVLVPLLLSSTSWRFALSSTVRLVTSRKNKLEGQVPVLCDPLVAVFARGGAVPIVKYGIVSIHVIVLVCLGRLGDGPL